VNSTFIVNFVQHVAIGCFFFGCACAVQCMRTLSMARMLKNYSVASMTIHMLFVCLYSCCW